MMLSELNTSHTFLYTRADWQYYDLLDLFKDVFAQEIKFLFPNGKVTNPNIGVFCKEIRGKAFVKAVLDGSSAFKAKI